MKSEKIQHIENASKLIQDNALMLSGLAVLRVLKEKYFFNEDQLNKFAKEHADMIAEIAKDREAQMRRR
jgi:hypothetical protein